MVFKHTAKPITKTLYFRRSERSTKKSNVSESGIQKKTRLSNCILAKVSVVQRFSMIRRDVFKNTSKHGKNKYFRSCVRSMRICNVSDTTASKPLKTHMYFVLIVTKTLRNKLFGASGGAKSKQITRMPKYKKYNPCLPSRCDNLPVSNKKNESCNKNMGIFAEVSIV